MKKQIRSILAFLISASGLFSVPAFSQDLKGGEIRVSQISGNTVMVYVDLYVKTSLDQGHPDLIVNHGDSTFDTIYVMGGSIVSNDVTVYNYFVSHTFPGPGTYNIVVYENFRIPNLANVTNSAAESVLMWADFLISPFITTNTTPHPVTHQGELLYSNGSILHNCSIFDVNGDSVSFSLIPCGTSNYTLPNVTIDSITGLVDLPVANQNGVYAVAILMKEWRIISNMMTNISTTIRNMTIEVPIVIAVGEYANAQNLRIFPNPFTDNAVIRFSKTLRENTQFVLCDATGREVKRETISGEQFLLERNGMASGVYYYCLEHNGEIMARGKTIMQ